MSISCEHGHLARVCEVCDRDRRIKELEEAVRVLAKEVWWSTKRSYEEWGSGGEDVMDHVPDDVKNNKIAAAAVRYAGEGSKDGK